MNNDEYINLRDYALKLLSFRPRSRNEMSIKLSIYCRKKKISPNLSDNLIKDLESRNLINDEDFAKWWVRQRHDFKPKGILGLKQELLQKGVAKDIIAKALMDETDGKQIEKAQSIITKKMNSYKYLPKNKLYGKISGFLIRRGFSFEIINQVIDSIEKKS